VTYYPLVNLAEGLAGRMSSGRGEGVLWIHGYALDSSSWSELWDLLPDFHHVALDLPGHGQSLPLPWRDDLPMLAGRLATLAREHGVRHLVGLSFGATLALQMAVEAPGAFATLVLGSPLPEQGAEGELFWTRYRELVTMYRMAGHGAHLRGRLMLVEPSPFEGVAGRPDLWRRLWDIVGRHGFWDLRDTALLRFDARRAPDESLRRIESSVLLVSGDQERAEARGHAERLARALPSCRSIQALGAGGHSLLEAPEFVAAAIAAHVRAGAGRMAPGSGA
jgi:pimeloyl-ACP methyl ester carboxylesterase